MIELINALNEIFATEARYQHIDRYGEFKYNTEGQFHRISFWRYTKNGVNFIRMQRLTRYTYIMSERVTQTWEFQTEISEKTVAKIMSILWKRAEPTVYREFTYTKI